MLRSRTIALRNLVIRFIGLWKLFAGEGWKSLELQSREARECCTEFNGLFWWECGRLEWKVKSQLMRFQKELRTILGI